MKKENKLLFALFAIFFFSLADENSVQINEDNACVYKIVILGSGPAGSAAAIQASRSQLDPIVIEGECSGGQITRATIIENWPGFVSISGSLLATNIKEHAKKSGAKFCPCCIKKVDFTRKPFVLYSTDDKPILAHSIIIATGSEPIKINCPGEDKNLGKGVAYCVSCDGRFFKDREVVVIGSGYGALKEADSLYKFTNKITIVNENSELNAPSKMVKQIKDKPGIKIINNTFVKEILDNGKCVTGIKVYNKETKNEYTITTQGVFIAIGRKPATDIFKNQIEMDSKDQITINPSTYTMTSVDGIFAAGDCSKESLHQAFLAAAFGEIAAIEAENYLKENKLI